MATELGLSPDTRVVGYFGSLVRRKRPLAFVDALAALRALRAGDGAGRAAVRRGPRRVCAGAIAARAAELGVAKEVRLMGFRYPPETWMAASDLLLVTAVDEPFGRTLIEAMLFGTPVIAAASGGNLEAIEAGRNGFLVAPDDIAGFARRARGAARRRAALGSVSGARGGRDARFGLDRHAEAIMAIYDQMLAEPAGRTGRTMTAAAAGDARIERLDAGRGGLPRPVSGVAPPGPVLHAERPAVLPRLRADAPPWSAGAPFGVLTPLWYLCFALFMGGLIASSLIRGAPERGLITCCNTSSPGSSCRSC